MNEIVIYVWIRRTLDWSDEQASLSLIDPRMVHAVRLWNSTFTISFAQFRRRLSEIARLSHSNAGLPVTDDLAEIPDDAIVLPVDDDDWFSPDVATVLRGAAEPGVTGYLWPSRWIEVPLNLGHRWHLITRRLRPSLPPAWTCSTNNFALVKRPGEEGLLRDHRAASRRFDELLSAGTGGIRQVPDPLSLANRSLASASTLRWGRRELSRGRLLRKYRCYRGLYRRDPSSELAWSRPYVRMMAELMEELKVRPR